MPEPEVPQLQFEFAFKIKMLFKERHFFEGPRGRRAFVQPAEAPSKDPCSTGA